MNKTFGPNELLVDLYKIKCTLLEHHASSFELKQMAGCYEDTKTYQQCSAAIDNLIEQIDKEIERIKSLFEPEVDPIPS